MERLLRELEKRVNGIVSESADDIRQLLMKIVSGHHMDRAVGRAVIEMLDFARKVLNESSDFDRNASGDFSNPLIVAILEARGRLMAALNQSYFAKGRFEDMISCHFPSQPASNSDSPGPTPPLDFFHYRENMDQLGTDTPVRLFFERMAGDVIRGMILAGTHLVELVRLQQAYEQELALRRAALS